MSSTNEEGVADVQRSFSGKTGMAVSVLCFAIALFHIYVAFYPVVSELQRNIFHFTGFAFLAAITYPALAGKTESRKLLIFDLIFGVAIAVSAVHLAYAESAIYDRGVKLAPQDWIAAIICIIGAVELTRRMTGWVIPLVILVSLSYLVFLGKLIPGVFHFPGLQPETILFRSIYGDDALFGSIARISSTYVFLFIIFGAFLVRSGAGDFVINMARALAGKWVGGPGIVAVMASALTGTISGSAVANTASTGVITIPLMKRAGFKPEFAGGVEAAASSGGQLMPPIMGAGAFVMASYTQIPYETIVAVAALPALLYFLSVIYFVRIEALRLNLQPMEASDITVKEAFINNGASFVIPIGILLILLVSGFTPTYAAVVGIVGVVVSSWLTKSRMGPKAVFEAMVMGTKTMIMTAVLLCAVGLIVNVIATAGIGNTFSLMITKWSGGNIMIALVLIALASLVLGMGLPVTAAYIVLATLSAPALAGMISDRFVIDLLADGNLPETAKAILIFGAPEHAGLLARPVPHDQATEIVKSLPLEVAAPLRNIVVPQPVAMTALLSAHMIIFWLSQDSNVTPPVALAAFTAAAIAEAPAVKTGIASWKLAKGLYIMPILFAYTPFLSGDWLVALTIFGLAVPGVYAIAAALQGGMEKPLGMIWRGVALIAGIACLWPGLYLVNVVGVVVVIALLMLNIRTGGHRQAATP